MVRASLIWLNYNSSGFIDIALRSIESALRLDFDDYEVIVVDNASSDGSFERIRRFVEERKPSSVRVKFVRSDANRGYSGGMNLGWETRDPEAKYVAFLNNDLILEPSSLRELIDYMEGDDKIAAVNGLLYLGGTKRICSVGGYVTEHWYWGSICWGGFEHECPSINKPHYVTYAEGAYMLVKAEIIRRVGPDGKPFIDETFLYLDDTLLGLILWNKGYKVAYVPIKAGYHYHGLTTKPIVNYYVARASTAMVEILNTRFSRTKQFYLLRRKIGYKALCAINDKYCKAYDGFHDGKLLAKHIINKLGHKLNIYKAPYAKLNYSEIILYDYLSLTTLLNRYLFITYDKITYHNQ